jgi:hypothetical protein
MKKPPSRSSTVLHGLPQGQNEQGKPPIKTYPARFDTLVARYYPAVYNFASRLTDDPRKAGSLTQRAFTSIRNQLWIPRDDNQRFCAQWRAVFWFDDVSTAVAA